MSDKYTSLCDDALKSMSVNELIHEYATAKLQCNLLFERVRACQRALVKISNHLYGVDPNAISPQQIAIDALNALDRSL